MTSADCKVRLPGFLFLFSDLFRTKCLQLRRLKMRHAAWLHDASFILSQLKVTSLKIFALGVFCHSLGQAWNWKLLLKMSGWKIVRFIRYSTEIQSVGVCILPSALIRPFHGLFQLVRLHLPRGHSEGLWHLWVLPVQSSGGNCVFSSIARHLATALDPHKTTCLAICNRQLIGMCIEVCPDRSKDGMPCFYSRSITDPPSFVSC